MALEATLLRWRGTRATGRPGPIVIRNPWGRIDYSGGPFRVPIEFGPHCSLARQEGSLVVQTQWARPDLPNLQRAHPLGPLLGRRESGLEVADTFHLCIPAKVRVPKDVDVRLQRGHAPMQRLAPHGLHEIRVYQVPSTLGIGVWSARSCRATGLRLLGLDPAHELRL